MQDSSGSSGTGNPRNLKEVRRLLEKQGDIYFERTLARTNAQNLHNSHTCLAIPRWFVDSHGDKFREIIYLVAAPTTRTWTVSLYITRPNYMNMKKAPQIYLRRGWNAFATFHGLVEKDRIIFSLKAMSTFEIYMFHGTGEPKESSFPITSRKPAIEIHKLLQTNGSEKFQERRATKLGGRKGMTAAQLVKDQTAQLLDTSLARVRKYYLNSKRKKDTIRSKKALNSNFDFREPDFVHSRPMERRHLPEVMGQEPADDVHQELVMPFTKNFVEISQDFVETKIISVGFEDKNQAQPQSQTSPLSFLSPSTFRNLNNLGGNMRVQTVVVLNGIPEMNGEAGDGAASSVSPVVQSNPSDAVQSDASAVLQSTLPVVGQSDPVAAVPSDPSTTVRSDPSTFEQSDPPAVVQPLVSEIRGASKQPIVIVPTVNGGTRRQHHRPWTLGEVMALVEGVARCGVGKWADVKKLGFSSAGNRTVVDLKDKWRNLVRASEAQLQPAKQGETQKHLSGIPVPILACVRDVASLANRIQQTRIMLAAQNKMHIESS